MGWFHRLINLIPDSPEGVWACVAFGGAIGAVAAQVVHDMPLAIGAFVCNLVGASGPPLIDLKRISQVRKSVKSAAEEERENALVDAYVREKQREATPTDFEESGADDDHSTEHRLH